MRRNLNQLVTADTPEEEQLLKSLRASSWDEFHGQEKIKAAILIGTMAAKKRAEALDHLLFYGPPGLGKPLFLI